MPSTSAPSSASSRETLSSASASSARKTTVRETRLTGVGVAGRLPPARSSTVPRQHACTPFTNSCARRSLEGEGRLRALTAGVRASAESMSRSCVANPLSSLRPSWWMRPARGNAHPTWTRRRRQGVGLRGKRPDWPQGRGVLRRARQPLAGRRRLHTTNRPATTHPRARAGPTCHRRLDAVQWGRHGRLPARQVEVPQHPAHLPLRHCATHTRELSELATSRPAYSACCPSAPSTERGLRGGLTP
jgi:hypothetical protein